jgi:thiosulfate dehydrogenase [quinone] large subunit
MLTMRLSRFQQAALVILRTLIGWHFLYEGYTKLLHPAWGQNGVPLQPWSSAAYLKTATGPLAPLFHRLGEASWIGSLDLLVAIALTAIGVSLMLGLFTQSGCTGAMTLLAMFYLAAIPTGRVDGRAEGTYLLVNKNLIEACAVAVLFAFRTGTIAGLDRLWRSPRTAAAGNPGMKEAAV